MLTGYFFLITEWQTGVKGRIILKDEDRSTRPEHTGGWKKLNTLQHYNVSTLDIFCESLNGLFF